jgi:enolase-phosphatase E1
LNPPLDSATIAAILLDIEGTTTSVSFVYHTLFPYARDQLRSYLEQHYDEPELKRVLERLRQEHAAEAIQPGCRHI